MKQYTINSIMTSTTGAMRYYGKMAIGKYIRIYVL